MAQEGAKSLTALETVVQLIARLTPADKLRLWDLLGKQLAQAKEEAGQQKGRPVPSGLQEIPTVYQAGRQLDASPMAKLHLPIIIEMDEDGYYIVSCPLYKGCHSYGETIDDALANIKEVVEMCLDETELEELNKFVGFRELEVTQNA